MSDKARLATTITKRWDGHHVWDGLTSGEKFLLQSFESFYCCIPNAQQSVNWRKYILYLKLTKYIVIS